jgi:hypothetical protein
VTCCFSLETFNILYFLYIDCLKIMSWASFFSGLVCQMSQSLLYVYSCLFLRFGNFSPLILLNIFSTPLVRTSSPSSMPKIYKFVF